MGKQFSASCERNQQAIFDVLESYFDKKEIENVLEIGSGTGQHAAYFSSRLKDVVWQPSDFEPNYESISSWSENLDNVLASLKLDVLRHTDWPIERFDAFYSANTFHIMPVEGFHAFFKACEKSLKKGGFVFVYGPFNYEGQFTSFSNEEFDAYLKQQASHMGIRDIEAVLEAATSSSLRLLQDHEMPANNRLLAFQRKI